MKVVYLSKEEFESIKNGEKVLVGVEEDKSGMTGNDNAIFIQLRK